MSYLCWRICRGVGWRCRYLRNHQRIPFERGAPVARKRCALYRADFAENWLSPVQIVDSKVLGLNLSVADGFEGGETHFSLTMNSSLGAPTIVDGNYVCKCVLEAVGNWAVDEEGAEPAFSASCKLGIVIVVPKAALEPVLEDERDTFVVANTVSIAYGKIRSIIESVTAESVVGRQTIPAIDPYAFVDSLGLKKGAEATE